MRKYFLTTAVALLTATNANAASTDNVSANVDVSAKIEVLSNFTCEDIDFGTIQIFENNEALTIYRDGTSDSEYFVSASGNGNYNCSATGEVFGRGEEVELYGQTDSNNVIIAVVPGDVAGVSLKIPANVVADTYKGTITVISFQ